MPKAKKKSKKGKDPKEVSLQIYARVRGLMPWEPKKVSLKVVGKSVENKAGKIVNSYDFKSVFKPQSTNLQCFQTIAMPMIANILKGFNAVLIAYGQTGSGKTFSMLGKPKLNIVGILPMTLAHMCKQPVVTKVELSAVEAFGHHVAKIFLFDLFNPENQVKEWTKKKGVTTIDSKKARKVVINDHNDAHDKIIYAHAGSHFAPTGKNPESSRGHVSFVATVHQSAAANMINTSYFVMVDCAGSEGETAFTPEFRSRVTPQVLLCRRLEAGTINTGLSQLQVIFNELRMRGKLTNALGNGLRRVLHPFINTKTFLSVLFTLSPSVNNSKATESTLKFAVTAGMVKVKPVMTKGKVNFKTLSVQLKAHIEKQEQCIDDNNCQIEALARQQNRTRIEIQNAVKKAKDPNAQQDDDNKANDDVQLPGGVQKKVRKVKVVNDDGDSDYDDVEYFVDASGKEINPTADILAAAAAPVPSTPAKMGSDVNDAMGQILSGLDDTQKEFMKGLGNSFLDLMTDKALSSDPNSASSYGHNNKTAANGRARTVTAEENDEAMKIAMAQYSKLTIPWQKERFLKKTKNQLAAKKRAKIDKQKEEEEKKRMLMIQESIRKSQEEMKNLEDKQKELAAKMADPNFAPQKADLAEHAMNLTVMLAEQKSKTKGLIESKAIIIQFLRDDGREALIKFFQVKGVLDNPNAPSTGKAVVNKIDLTK